ncbi:M23 family metallopeptidase [Streptomyces sp. NPDC004111]|uniref:M23 family metallopeptidase n=1 Tax=Streptomyces sp. NPDC004111 TaxID=3364690 RepID=UPI0036BE5613
MSAPTWPPLPPAQEVPPVTQPPPADDDAARPAPKRRRRGPGPFTLLVLPGLTVLLGGAVFLAYTGQLPGMAGDGEGVVAADAPDPATGRVDPSYVPWLKKAAQECTAVRPSVLAGQIDAHSGWNPDSASLSEAEGVAGFTAAQWRTWGRDDDGNGSSSPRDPVDAIMALGRQDCALAAGMTRLRTRGTVAGELLDLTLAARSVGEKAVADAGRVPDAARAHVRRVGKLAAQYTAFDKAAPLPGAEAAPRQGYLHWPLRTTTVSSAYGTRKHPLSGVTKLHTGVDFAADRGVPVGAAGPGTVVFAAPTKAYGNRVVIDHGVVDGRRLETTYSHLSVLRSREGQTVTPGTVVGDVGSTGLSTGPHLHFEVVVNGYYADPMPWLDARS